MDSTHPTVAEINLANLLKNFCEIQKLAGKGVKVIPIVKADAYGHGAVAVSRSLESLGCDTFGVGYLEEGVELRRAGVSGSIILYCGIFAGQEEALVENNLEPVIYTVDTIERLKKEAAKRKKKIPVHIKIDTGMGRLGFPTHKAGSIINSCIQSEWLQVKGLLTHFAEADSGDPSFTHIQVKLFEDVISQLRDKADSLPLIYASNSAAIIQFKNFPFNAVRPGIILYGVSPLGPTTENLMLSPVMELKTRIVQLKKTPSGTSISYGRKFFTERDSLIAVIPVGYADGYSRAFSNRAEVLVKGRRAPQVGTICMDSCMIDVTDIHNIKVDDSVVLLGQQESEKITASEVSSWAGTIPYEIFCNIGRRVKRSYINQS